MKNRGKVSLPFICVYICVCRHRHTCVCDVPNIKLDMFMTAYSKYYTRVIRGLEVLLRNSNILRVPHTITDVRDHLNLRNDVHYTSCPAPDSSDVLHGYVLGGFGTCSFSLMWFFPQFHY